MEVLFAIPVLLIAFMPPIIAGFMAISFGRKFWPWFWLSIPFPVIVHCILICLPEKPSASAATTRPEEMSTLVVMESGDIRQKAS